VGQRVYNEDGTYRVEGKRSPGEGAWSARTGGGWRYQVMHDGQRLRTDGRTKSDARTAMKELITRMDAGVPPRDARITVAAWMSEWRRVQLEARPRKPTTKATYNTLSRLHIEPETVGKIPLDKLKASDVDRLLIRLRAKGLSESSVRQVYHVLRLALSDAVRDNLLARNPVELVDRPVAPRREARYLSPAEMVRLLEAAKDSRYYPVLALIAATGVRRGEALGLHWADVDLVGATMQVRGTLARVGGELIVTETKTTKSRRTIELAPEVVDLLARHKDTQEAEARRAANKWSDTDFVFTTETGNPVDGRNLFRTMQAAASKAGIKDVGIHTLRHSMASALMDAGANIKVVSDLLGHSSVAITGDIYVHATSDGKRSAMVSMAQMIGL
jgi:integrase